MRRKLQVEYPVVLDLKKSDKIGIQTSCNKQTAKEATLIKSLSCFADGAIDILTFHYYQNNIIIYNVHFVSFISNLVLLHIPCW